MDPCLECRLAQGSPEAPILWRGERFHLHPVVGGGAVPGWLVLAPLRHVEQVDALTPAEAAELGPLLVRAGAALRAATGCPKLYVGAYGEVVPHLHLHLIARPTELAAEERGFRLFGVARRADPAEVARVGAAVQAALAVRD